MRIWALVVWTVVSLFVMVAPTLGHCGKDHSKVQVAQLTLGQLQYGLTQPAVSADTLLLEGILKEQDKKEQQERREKDLNLEKLIKNLQEK